MNADNARTKIRDEKQQSNLRVCERGRESMLTWHWMGCFCMNSVRIDRGSDKK